MNKGEKRCEKFIKLAGEADKEEQVVDAYQHLVGADDWPRPFGSDGVNDDTLFEFKLDKKLAGVDGRSGLAQCCYYLREAQNVGVFKGKHYPVPMRVAVCDKNEALVVEAVRLEKFFGSDAYDWGRPASSPDPKLVEALAEIRPFVHDMVTPAGVQAFLADLASSGTAVSQRVTVDNFALVFQVWKESFAQGLTPQQAALAYLLDLQRQTLVNEDKGVIVYDVEGQVLKVKADIAAYRQFWKSYSLPPDPKQLIAILKRKDWLVVMQQRRSTGEFFTPTDFARLGRQYILEAEPKALEEWNWWDMCCGTGNLEVDFPPMPGRLFMSTLNGEDVSIVKGSGMAELLKAEVFKYDFLNQTDEELPEALRKKLVKGSKWVFFFNPPFAAGSGMGGAGEAARSRMSATAVGEEMGESVGFARQNIMAQFVWRVGELARKYELDAVVGVFSQAVWVTGSAYSRLQIDWLKKFNLAKAFCFEGGEFEGTSGRWPAIFSVWRSRPTGAKAPDSAMSVATDVWGREGERRVKLGGKTFAPAAEILNKWPSKPSSTETRPPVSSAIVQSAGKKIRADTMAPAALGYLLSHGNDVQQSAQVVALFSSVFGDGHGWSVDATNFQKSLVVMAARKLVRDTWFNHNDGFAVPDEAYPNYPQFANDAVVFALFNGKNQSSSLGGLQYKGKTYDIKNEFFWMTKAEFLALRGLSLPLYKQANADTERYTANQLQLLQLSPDATEVLKIGKELVALSLQHRDDAEVKYQLNRWDAGWYQIRNGLYGDKVKFKKTPEMEKKMEEFKVAYKKLGDRLRPLIYELGFLPEEKVLDDDDTGA